MFSGIIRALGEVVDISHGSRTTLTIKSEIFAQGVTLGDSIAVCGACLTVEALEGEIAQFFLLTETLRCTSLGDLAVGSKVNLERSLQVGDRIDGHFVQGHVDAVVALKDIEQEGSTIKLHFELKDELRRYIAKKGSVCLDGVSLTVGETDKDSFSVYIIPHTATSTTLGGLKRGSRVNIEVDCLSRYVENILSNRQG